MIPRPTLEQSVQALAERDEYKVIVQFIKDERDRFFGDLRQAEGANDVMKIAGSIASMDELLGLLDKQQVIVYFVRQYVSFLSFPHTVCQRG